MTTDTCAIGVDIGGTKIAAALVTADGAAKSIQKQPTPSSSPPDIIETVAAMCRDLMLSTDAPISGIGIGATGQVDVERGMITYGGDAVRAWAGVRLADEVAQRTGMRVIVDNDVNAMALGEAQFGAGRGINSGLYVMVGTGIGGALVINGELWRGARWSAGEIGHTLVDWRGERRCPCGQMGHLEGYAAGPAMARHYCALTGQPPHGDLRRVAECARDGDTAARDVIVEGARILGLALGGLVSAFDPDVLVISGGVPQLGDLWWQPFEAALRESPVPAAQGVDLRRAALGTGAVLIGAAWLAMARGAA